MSAISANKAELLAIANAVASEKMIDKAIVVEALEEALQCAGALREDEAEDALVRRLLAPAEPSKIVCVGRNYLDHIRELGNDTGDLPAEPGIFLKGPNALAEPGGTVQLWEWIGDGATTFSY